MKYQIQCDNTIGKDLHWVITDGNKFFHCWTAADSIWLCDSLNEPKSTNESKRRPMKIRSHVDWAHWLFGINYGSKTQYMPCFFSIHFGPLVVIWSEQDFYTQQPTTKKEQ